MTGDQSQGAALFAAIGRGRLDEVEAAIAAGEPLDARDEDDWSPLERAAGSGDAAMVQLLLDHGADPTSTGREQRTAYEIALAAGHRSIAEVLREREEAVDPSARARHEWRPYCRAYRLGELRAYAHLHQPPEVAELGDAEVVFVHDDLSVTLGIWPGEDLVVVGRPDDWRRFCRDILGFRVPDDFDLLPAD
jgi:ankyrin repeat protein